MILGSAQMRVIGLLRFGSAWRSLVVKLGLRVLKFSGSGSKVP